MNSVNLIGRLVREPEVRYSQGSEPCAIARYTLAVDGYNEDDTSFISCVAFGTRGEFAEKYLRKGMKIAVSGRIKTGSYENKNGDTVYTTDVIVNEHYFCEKKNDDESSKGGSKNGQKKNYRRA